MDSPNVTRHWLLVNSRGDLVSWVDSEAQAKGIKRAYPLAKLEIQGPFVLEAEQPRRAVEDRRILSHALTLALKGRVSNVSETKDALIKAAGEALYAHGGQA